MRIRYGLGLGLTVMIWAATAGGSEPVRIDDRRELFVDNFLVEGLQGGACRVMHRPIPREIVMTFDKPWEGNACGYFTIFQDGNIYRMYYRGCSFTIKDDKLIMSTRRACYAESEDGRYWKRPKLGLFEFEGSKENNIVWAGDGCENFTVFKDENPKCAKEVRYKAVGLRVGRGVLQKRLRSCWALYQATGYTGNCCGRKALSRTGGSILKMWCSGIRISVRIGHTTDILRGFLKGVILKRRPRAIL